MIEEKLISLEAIRKLIEERTGKSQRLFHGPSIPNINIDSDMIIIVDASAESVSCHPYDRKDLEGGVIHCLIWDNTIETLDGVMYMRAINIMAGDLIIDGQSHFTSTQIEYMLQLTHEEALDHQPKEFYDLFFSMERLYEDFDLEIYKASNGLYYRLERELDKISIEITVTPPEELSED